MIIVNSFPYQLFLYTRSLWNYYMDLFGHKVIHYRHTVGTCNESLCNRCTWFRLARNTLNDHRLLVFSQTQLINKSHQGDTTTITTVTCANLNIFYYMTHYYYIPAHACVLVLQVSKCKCVCTLYMCVYVWTLYVCVQFH